MIGDVGLAAVCLARRMATSKEKGSALANPTQLARESTLAQEAADRAAEASKDEASKDESSWALPSAESALIRRWLWPHSSTPLPHTPRIQISLSTTRPSYSLSSKDPLLIRVKAVLQAPCSPITIYSKRTIIDQNPNPSAFFGFDLVDSSTAEKVSRYPVDAMTIDDWRGKELSYRYAGNFVTMEPGVPVMAEHGFIPRVDDVVPLRVGRRYRVEISGWDVGSRIEWWRYGRKWEVLRWRSSFWGRKEYAFSDDQESQGPAFVYLVEGCEFEVTE